MQPAHRLASFLATIALLNVLEPFIPLNLSSAMLTNEGPLKRTFSNLRKSHRFGGTISENVPDLVQNGDNIISIRIENLEKLLCSMTQFFIFLKNNIVILF